MAKQKLNDPTLPVHFEPRTLDKPKLIEQTIAGDKINFVVGADGKVGISLFNSEGDEDPSELFGKSGTAPIPFNSSNAWLKYTAAANIKLKSGLDIKGIGFDIDMKAGLESYVYRKHRASEFLDEARTEDILALKTIFLPDNIKELDINEAVGLEFNGTLNTVVTLSWSDIWTTQLSALGQLLDTSELIKLKFGPEVSIQAGVKVEDTFRTQIVKKGANKFFLFVKRNTSRAVTAGLSLNVTVSIENPEVFTKQLDALFENLLHVGFDKLQKIVAKKESSLSENEKEIIKVVADKLGLPKDGVLGLLKEKLEGYYEDFKTKADEAVRTKITAGFTYEYLRSTEKENIFSTLLTGKAIDEFHLEILKARTAPLIAAAKKSSPLLEDVKFMNKEVKVRQKTWGFSIGFGKWVAADQQKINMTVTKRETQKGIQLSYDGKRTFEDKVDASGRNWRVDFNASMPHISNLNIPLANEFDYSLFLNYSWTEKKFNKKDLFHFLDLCLIWNVINEGQFTELSESLVADLKGGKDYSYSCHVTYPAELFRTMIAIMGGTSDVLDDVFYESLGAALPYWDAFALRMDPERRAQHYGPIWKEFLATDSAAPEEIAFQHLKSVDKNLAKEELNYKPNNFINFNSFAFNANANPQTKRRWEAFRSGVRALSLAIDVKALQPHSPVINNSFQKMEDLWNFPIHIRAFGNYLSRVAKESTVAAVCVGELKFKSGGEEQTILIGKS